MDDQVKAKWVAALRSGEYKQAKEKLADVNPRTGEVTGYCCLGVLCDLAVKEGVTKTPYIANEFNNIDDAGDRLVYGDVDGGILDYSATQLPQAVVEWAGLDDTCPSVSHPNPDYDPAADEYEPESREELHNGLAELNDDYDYDFKTIADLIEAEL